LPLSRSAFIYGFGLLILDNGKTTCAC